LTMASAAGSSSWAPSFFSKFDLGLREAKGTKI
jgi:hypothetical protein